MKTLLIVALAVLLGSAPVGIVCADDIYWDPGEARDIEITAKDLPFKIMDPVKQPKSLGQLEVYDVAEPEPEAADLPEPVVAAPAPQRPESERPTYREPTRRTPGSGESGPSVTPSRRERPQPAPAAQKPKSKREKPSVPGEADKPDTKKLPWGKADAPAPEPQKQLQWGQDK